MLTPVQPSPAALAASIGKLKTLVESPEGQAVLAELEADAARFINGLPCAGTGKPGWRTSEFWCLVVFFLLSLFTMLAGVLPAQWAMGCQVVSIGLYQISRGLAKQGSAN